MGILLNATCLKIEWILCVFKLLLSSQFCSLEHICSWGFTIGYNISLRLYHLLPFSQMFIVCGLPLSMCSFQYYVKGMYFVGYGNLMHLCNEHIH
jgi:hypothetical protein